MIDIKPAFDEGMRNIRTWRNRYSETEYPHKVVINMMYRAYAMDYIWNEFKNSRLPRYNSINEALIGMEKHYSTVTANNINANLLNWLRIKPNERIGTLIYHNYEKIAKEAELNYSKKEELEFSYLFNLLQDKLVQYYIAIRLTGKNMQETITAMTNYMIEPISGMTYEIAKQAFQQLYVARFMNDNYRPLP